MPAPNLSNCQKREGHGPEHDPECRSRSKISSPTHTFPSKKLHLLTVDIGDKVVNCVCGAPNVRVGQKVAFATAGGRVIAGEIGKAMVAGYESEGMCCSEKELGISDGILKRVAT